MQDDPQARKSAFLSPISYRHLAIRAKMMTMMTLMVMLISYWHFGAKMTIMTIMMIMMMVTILTNISCHIITSPTGTCKQR